MMEKNEEKRWAYSFRKKPVLKLLLSKKKDGFFFTITLPNIGDIHLICIEEDGRIKWHISDKTYGDNAQIRDRVPLSSQISHLVFQDRLNRITQRWIRQLPENTNCWIMTQYLKNRIAEIKRRFDSNPNQISIEFAYAGIRFDFFNHKRWKRISIKELRERPTEIAFLTDKGVIRKVHPFGTNKVVCYSKQQLTKFENFIGQTFGFEDYIEYLKEQKGVKIHLK